MGTRKDFTKFASAGGTAFALGRTMLPARKPDVATLAHAATPARDKFRQMKELIASPQLEFLMEAHNGLSARIVEEAGFRGIWASGLTISASLGVRDNNEASWTQVLDLLEFMSDATSIPILLDGDTGYGNFNNMQRLVRKLEQRNVAAVCIEDKLFPKTNSFIKGELQQLADIEEFAGKIKAGKDAQRHDEFSIVARCEAFIAGWGLAEAVKRAEAYRLAGADAILMHSALATPDEVLSFCREWAHRSPVVIVPTIYYTTPTELFREHDISVVIWANHLLRAAIKTMQATAKTIHDEESLIPVDHNIASVKEIFRLQGANQLEHAEALYLPRGAKGTRAVVLAASRGSALGELTQSRPKTMVGVAGKPLLDHIASTYKAAGVNDITVVRGYQKEAVNLSHLTYVDNDQYETTGELTSLQKALDVLPADTETLIISYGDVLFRKHVPEMLLEVRDDFVVMVDTNWRESANRDRVADYVSCSVPYTRRTHPRGAFLQRIACDLPETSIHGEWMGFLKVSGRGVTVLEQAASAALTSGGAKRANMQSLLTELISRGETIRVVYTSGHWLDIDSLEDVVSAGSFR
jgi:phosphoenolpyruvate phosphomutase